MAGGRYAKQKGNKYEKLVADIFDEWVKREFGMEWFERPFFSRTPRSGAMRKETPLGLENKVVGDIMAPETFAFVVEAKNQKRWSLPGWMAEIRGEIEESGSSKPFAIIMHEHGTSNEFIVMNLELFLDLVDPKKLVSEEELTTLVEAFKTSS